MTARFQKYIFIALSFFWLALHAEKMIIHSTKEAGTMRENSQNKIVTDSYGNYYVVFNAVGVGKTQVWIYISHDGGRSWAPLGNRPATTYSLYSQNRAAIGIDSQDRIYVVWYGNDSSYTNGYWDVEDEGQWKEGEYQIKCVTYYNGVYSDPVYVSEIQGYKEWIENYQDNDWTDDPMIENWQELPSIAFDSQDNAYVVWEGEDDVYKCPQIKFSKSRDNGQTWSDPVNLTKVTMDGDYYYLQEDPNVIVDKNDWIWVVWFGKSEWHGYTGSTGEYSPVNHMQYLVSKDGGSTWSTNGYNPLNTSRPNQAIVMTNTLGVVTTNGAIYAADGGKSLRFPSLCYDEDRDIIHMVFCGRESGYPGLNRDQIRYMNHMTGREQPLWDGWWWGGNNNSPVSLSAVSTYWSYEQSRPDVTVDSSGTVHVIWHGNSDTYLPYSDLDPDTAVDDSGYYIFYSKSDDLGTNWTEAECKGKGFNPHFVKNPHGGPLAWVYQECHGWDDFKIWFDSDTSVALPGTTRTPQAAEEKNFYISPLPMAPSRYNAVFQYFMGASGNVKIQVHDIAGREVVLLTDDTRDKGYHEFYWDGSYGIYSDPEQFELIGGGQKIKPGMYILSFLVDDQLIKQIELPVQR